MPQVQIGGLLITALAITGPMHCNPPARIHSLCPPPSPAPPAAAYLPAASPARFVLVSSAGVTRPHRPGIDVEKEPPAVKMNAMLGGILDYKLKGEGGGWVWGERGGRWVWAQRG